MRNDLTHTAIPPQYVHSLIILFFTSLLSICSSSEPVVAHLPYSFPSPMLYHLPVLDDNDHIFIPTADLTSQNKTYVIDQSQFIMKRTHETEQYTAVIEMEIVTPLSPSEFLLFGINKDKAISYDVSTDSYSGIYIDTRAYYLQKQYYRILLVLNEASLNNESHSANKYYLTIFYRTDKPAFRELKFNLRVQLVDSSSTKADKPCPFDCLNHGICNPSTGKCDCSNGYVDHDCSKPSEMLRSNSRVPHTNTNEESTLTEWTVLFDSHHSQASFYHIPLLYESEGFLYLQVSSARPMESIEVFYTLETVHFSNLGIADKGGFAKISKTIHANDLSKSDSVTEIFLDKFSRINSEQLSATSTTATSSTSSSLSPDHILLFGFRSHPSTDTMDTAESAAKYQMKLTWISESTYLSKNQGFIALLRKNMIILISLIVLMVILLLLILLIWRLRLSANRYEVEQQLLIASKKEKKHKVDEDIQKIMQEIKSLDCLALSQNPQWMRLVEDAKKDSTNEPGCSICLCEFESNDTIKVTHCPHFFHNDCLFEWLKKQKNCPHCRNPLTLEALQELQTSAVQTQDLKPTIPQLTTAFSPMRKKLKTTGYCEQIDESVFNNSVSIGLQENQLYQKFSLEFTPKAHRDPSPDPMDPNGQGEKKGELDYEQDIQIELQERQEPFGVGISGRRMSMLSDLTPQLTSNKPLFGTQRD